MADTKISALTTLADASLASGDYFVVVDVSDTSMAASGTTKKIAASGVGAITTTFTPVFADASSGGNVATVAAAAGWYTRIGGRIWVDIFFDNISTSGLTSGNSVYIRGLPVASLNSANYRATGSVFFSRINYTDRFVSAFLNYNTSYLTLQSHPNTGNATPTNILVSDLTGGTGFVDLVISISYLV